MTNEVKRECGTCKFRVPDPCNEGSFICVANPPQYRTDSGFPTVQSHYWCGKYSMDESIKKELLNEYIKQL